MNEFADLPALSRADVAWARDQYIGAATDAGDWRASPLRCPSLVGAAPALVVTAECDVLRDEGEAYAARLRDAGVPTALRRHDGLPHGFFSMGAFVDAARRAVEETCSALRDAVA
jgi:acetyl esterase